MFLTIHYIVVAIVACIGSIKYAVPAAGKVLRHFNLQLNGVMGLIGEFLIPYVLGIFLIVALEGMCISTFLARNIHTRSRIEIMWSAKEGIRSGENARISGTSSANGWYNSKDNTIHLAWYCLLEVTVLAHEEAHSVDHRLDTTGHGWASSGLLINPKGKKALSQITDGYSDLNMPEHVACLYQEWVTRSESNFTDTFGPEATAFMHKLESAE